MTNANETPQPATQDLDDASLDLVVGAGGLIIDADLRRKQEQEDKLAGGDA